MLVNSTSSPCSRYSPESWASHTAAPAAVGDVQFKISLSGATSAARAGAGGLPVAAGARPAPSGTDAGAVALSRAAGAPGLQAPRTQMIATEIVTHLDRRSTPGRVLA